ncbi:fructose bisphosphate aldolase [Alphaproteobacteria bacterium]|jgi:fructose-bisphosphate aldolase, class I|nr:fructose bisphosphate aldolase [Alphaproteobacteria bacterium]
MSFEKQLEKATTAPGFVAALDQSGGSTPKALGLYGIGEDRFSNDVEMFALMQAMRARIMTSPAFDGSRVMGAILFERTMREKIGDLSVPAYLWQEKSVVPFLKVDKGLEGAANGVKLMKPMPGLEETLAEASTYGVFGTKMRSVIDEASTAGIAQIVEQQFEEARRIIGCGLMPIIEPEITITSPEKSECEALLLAELTKAIEALADDQKVMLKLSLPNKAGHYSSLCGQPKIARVVALSGGYSRDLANEMLCQNQSMIASFSRALSEGLSDAQTDDEFNATLGASIQSIYDASVA